MNHIGWFNARLKMMDAMPDGFYGYGENIRSVWRTLTEKRTLPQLSAYSILAAYHGSLSAQSVFLGLYRKDSESLMRSQGNIHIGQRQSDLRQHYIVSASLDQPGRLPLPEVGSNS